MPNPPRYLKPSKRMTAPSVVFSIVCETAEVPNRNTRVYRDLIFSRAVACVSRKKGGKWSVPRLVEFDKSNELWEWIESNADKQRRNYIVAPIMSDVLTLTTWWHYAEQCGISFRSIPVNYHADSIDNDDSKRVHVRRALFRGAPDILDYSHDSKRYICVSGRQFLDSTEEEIAKSIGHRLPSVFPHQSLSMFPFDDVQRRCLLWSVAFAALADWWSEHAAAPFGLTVGQLSIGVLRTHVKPKLLCSHSESNVHQLERHACYGGRASLWYVGDIRGTLVSPPDFQRAITPSEHGCILGPITHIDIRSMYPSLLRDKTFPCRLAKQFTNISADSLKELMSLYHVIANVTLETRLAEYPYRRDNRVYYPQGYFQTVLAGPELALALEDSNVRTVHTVACYIAGRPFEKAASYLLDMRLRARQSGDLAWELFAKTLANALGGKLAQRAGAWKDLPGKIATMKWGQWIEYNCDAKTASKFRSICGIVSEYLADESGEGPYTSCFAYLTAYGRALMRSLRATFPPYAIIQQDTDGLWCAALDTALVSIGGVSFGDLPGQLRVTQIAHNARFFGPRHYYTDAGWVLSGFHAPAVSDSTLRITDTFSSNPLVSGSDSMPERLRVSTRESTLALDTVGGEVFPDGWVRPMYLDPPI